MFGFSPYYRPWSSSSSEPAYELAFNTTDLLRSPRSAGNAATEVNQGSEWFSLHSTSVGISFGSVATFLLLLLLIWSCFKSRMCGIFNCCLWCQPSPRPASTSHAAGPPPPSAFPTGAGAAVVYDPYAHFHPGSASSSIYGTTFGPAHAIAPAPTHLARGIGMDSASLPLSRSLALDPPSRPRERSPSSVSRVFFNARRDAARYCSRFSDLTEDRPAH